MSQNSQKLKLGALIALVVGSMIGGGIFSLPQNMAVSAGAGATVIGWLITAVGMLCLAFVFQNLANRKPHLNNGVYAYAKAGFGDYLGFSSAWGYWISAWIGNVSYIVLMFSTLGFFFPIFGEGNTFAAIVCASLWLWGMHFMILRGIREAAFVNIVVTIAKVVPIVVFVVLTALAFKAGVFTSDFWGQATRGLEGDLGSVMDQVKNMMLVTVWVFIGIEGASVYSARAAKRSDVGKATVLGFLGVLALLILVNVLSLGVMQRADVAALQNPSMAHVLAHVVGPWGAVFVSVGLVISLVGALLSWVLLCAEILYTASSDNMMPKFLKKENKNGVPINALYLSNAAVQVFLLITLFNSGTYLQLVYLATSMILLPYFFSSVYGFLVASRKEGYSHQENNKKDMFIALVSTVYSVWLLYAAGIQYLLLSLILYMVGIPFYTKARNENNQKFFTNAEKIYCAIVVIGGVLAAIGLATGKLSL